MQVIQKFHFCRCVINAAKGWLYIKDNITDRIPGSDMSYVPDSPEFAIPYKNQITIEQLLQHSAGVYDVDNDPVPGYDGLSYVDYMTFKRSCTSV
ncbi:MAG: hypothetical protein R3A12_06335 [Ignavibacteria bacterium]